jgi:hypothetical protein
MREKNLRMCYTFLNAFSVGKGVALMLKKIGRWPVLALTVVLGTAGFFLRRSQLAAFSPEGLPGGGVWGLAILCLLALGAFAAVAFTAEGETETPVTAEPFCKVPMILGGVLLAAGNALVLSGALALKLAALLGILSGACFVITPFRKAYQPAALWLLPIAYFILRLILNFKSWSMDPIILDYCFRLFAMIFTMLSAFLAGGFAFGEGRRRVSLFFALGGVFFCIVALADGGTEHFLQTGGALFYLAANAYGLMRE